MKAMRGHRALTWELFCGRLGAWYVTEGIWPSAFWNFFALIWGRGSHDGDCQVREVLPGEC